MNQSITSINELYARQQQHPEWVPVVAEDYT